jgi:hypothetical protein
MKGTRIILEEKEMEKTTMKPCSANAEITRPNVVNDLLTKRQKKKKKMKCKAVTIKNKLKKINKAVVQVRT